VPPAQTFPNEDVALTSYYLNQAREIAGDRSRIRLSRPMHLFPDLFAVREQRRGSAADSSDAGVRQPLLHRPGRGLRVGSEDKRGLVIIDSLNNPSEAEYILVEGLRKLGLNPRT
jgi:hypothetical protein